MERRIGFIEEGPSGQITAQSTQIHVAFDVSCWFLSEVSIGKKVLDFCEFLFSYYSRDLFLLDMEKSYNRTISP
jgi:hypothetical protein